MHNCTSNLGHRNMAASITISIYSTLGLSTWCNSN